jgi:hypothetical protein
MVGLLYQPQMMVVVTVEQLMERELSRKIKVLGENLHHCHFVRHKSQMT